MRYRRGWVVLGGTTAACVGWFVAMAGLMDRLRPSVGLLLLALAPATLVLALAVAQLVLLRPSRRLEFETPAGPPSSFAAGPTGLPLYHASGAVALSASIAGSWLAFDRHLVVTVTALLAVAVAAALIGVALRGRPRIELRPDGVTVCYAYGTRHLPWAAFADAEAPRPRGPGPLVLPLARPDLVRGSGLATRPVTRLSLPSSWFDIHPWFLADAIRFYVRHPEHRRTIGTAAGLDHLRGQLIPAP